MYPQIYMYIYIYIGKHSYKNIYAGMSADISVDMSADRSANILADTCKIYPVPMRLVGYLYGTWPYIHIYGRTQPRDLPFPTFDGRNNEIHSCSCLSIRNGFRRSHF